MIGLVDIGGTKTMAAVSRDVHSIPENVVVRPTPKSGNPKDFLTALLDEARAGQKLDVLAMAVPGPFDRNERAFVNPPNLPKEWSNFNLQTGLGEYFDCDVYAENDANCAALAEANAGAGRGYRTVVYYTVSTGIGTGVVRDGKLVIARHDNEGGHQVLWPRHLGGPRCECGGYGCLEALASGSAIEKRFGVHAEDLDDQEIWNEIAMWLGLAVVNATALLDPDIVIFGGGVIHSWERIRHELQKTVDEYLHLQPHPVIAEAQLGVERNLIGALSLIPQEALSR